MPRPRTTQERIEQIYPDIAGDIRFNAQKLVKRCIKDANTGCWNVVRGAMHRQGYGMVGAYRITDDKHIMTTAHRAIKKLELKTALPRNQEVYHKCSNMRCCNPDHLLTGSHRDVMTHMVANDRHAKTRPHGNKNHGQKRQYKYSIAEKLFFRYATTAEIVARYPAMPRQRANKLSWSARRTDHSWLDDYLPGGPQAGQDK